LTVNPYLWKQGIDADIAVKDRAKLLEDAEFFSTTHTNLAQQGQSSVPEDLDVDNHFICFVEAVNAKGYVVSTLPMISNVDGFRDKRVVELDGGRNGPLDRGECTSLLHVS
jgi:ubiquitin carboxyl-terminal hydrolase L3